MDKCPICLEVITGEYYEMHCCKAFFCADCLDEWENQNAIFTCPHCRKPLDGIDVPTIPLPSPPAPPSSLGSPVFSENLRDFESQLGEQLSRNMQQNVREHTRQMTRVHRERNFAIICGFVLVSLIYILLKVKGPL